MATTKEFREIHTIHQTVLEKELGHPVPLPQEVRQALDQRDAASAEQAVAKAAAEWLGLLNLAVTPHLLRNYISERGAEDSALRALIRFLVSKKSHSQEDRDKVDWLATYLFKKREEKKGRHTSWPKSDVQEILEGFEFPELIPDAEERLMEIPALLDEVNGFEHFSQITDSRIIQRARDLKNQFGDEFFRPDVLAALVNYNLLFGMKFHALLQETMRKVREFAQSRPESCPPDTDEFLQTDYRLTGEALRHLGEMGRKEVLGATPAATPGNLPGQVLAPEQARTPEQQLKQLGISVEEEALYLRQRMEELAMRLRSNLSLTSIANPLAPLMLAEWEATALRTPYLESEQNFRANFARGISRAIAIICRIYEEIPPYLEKRGTEYLWKRHYDSLVYLLYEGRGHKENLLQLAEASQQRGLREKSKQLLATAQKLDTSLAKVAELF